MNAPTKQTKRLKAIDKLLFEQGGKCFYCQDTLDRSRASVDHIVPKSLGGSNRTGNLVACCKSINTYFGNMDVREKMQIFINHGGRIPCPRHLEKEAPKPKPIQELKTTLFESPLVQIWLKAQDLPHNGKALSDSKAKAASKQITTKLLYRPKTLATLIRSLNSFGMSHEGADRTGTARLGRKK